MPKFPFYRQQDSMDCGPTCLRMVAKHYGKNFNINQLRQQAEISKEGVNLLGIATAAEKIGCRTRQVKISFKELIEDAPLPAILHWGQHHFVVACPNPTKGGFFKAMFYPKWKRQGVLIADPAKGVIWYNKKEFLQNWASTTNGNEAMGIALLLEPTPAFYQSTLDNDVEPEKKQKDNSTKGIG